MRKYIPIFLVFVLISTLIFIGCGKETQTTAPATTVPTTTATATAKPTTAAPTTTAPKPILGGILKWNTSTAPTNFGDPINVRATSDAVCTEPIYEYLVRCSEEKPGAYAPELATSWTLAPDKSSYTLTLRKGVKFHDGTDFNAAAAKWNLDRVVASPSSYLKKVKSIDIVDDYTIRLNLTSWDSLFLRDLTQYACAIISPTAYTKNGADWAKTNIVATGPFKQKSYSKDAFILAKNPDYWNTGLPYIDEIDLSFIPDATTASIAFKNGDFDVWLSPPYSAIKELLATGKATVQPGPVAMATAITLNSVNASSPWSDKRMRQALEYAIDKEGISNAATYGIVKTTYELIRSIHGAGGKPNTVPRKYDPAKAKQLMTDAGYPNGFALKLSYATTAVQEIPLTIQAQLAKVGITVTLNPIDAASYSQKSITTGAVGNELMVGTITIGTSDFVMEGVKSIFSPTSTVLVGVKRTAGVVDLMNQALQIEDPAQVLKLVEKIEELAYDDAMYINIMDAPINFMVNTSVVGKLPYNYIRGNRWQFIWLDRGKK